MGRIISYLAILVLLGIIGIAAYALFAELPPPTMEMQQSVDIDALG